MTYASSRWQLSSSWRFVVMPAESPLSYSGPIAGHVFFNCFLFIVLYLGINIQTRLEVKNIIPSALKWDLNSGRKTGGIGFEFRSRKKMQKLPPTRVELVRPNLLECALLESHGLSCSSENRHGRIYTAITGNLLTRPGETGFTCKLSNGGTS